MMSHTNQFCLATKYHFQKRGEPTQIDSPVVTQMNTHANKQSKVEANVVQNIGFNKCSTFQEIACIALVRAFELNSGSLVRVNLFINNRNELSAYFFYGTNMVSIHYFYSSVVKGHSLYDLHTIFNHFESLKEEGIHVDA